MPPKRVSLVVSADACADPELRNVTARQTVSNKEEHIASMAAKLLRQQHRPADKGRPRRHS